MNLFYYISMHLHMVALVREWMDISFPVLDLPGQSGFITLWSRKLLLCPGSQSASWQIVYTYTPLSHS